MSILSLGDRRSRPSITQVVRFSDDASTSPLPSRSTKAALKPPTIKRKNVKAANSAAIMSIGPFRYSAARPSKPGPNHIPTSSVVTVPRHSKPSPSMVIPDDLDTVRLSPPATAKASSFSEPGYSTSSRGVKRPAPDSESESDQEIPQEMPARDFPRAGSSFQLSTPPSSDARPHESRRVVHSSQAANTYRGSMAELNVAPDPQALKELQMAEERLAFETNRELKLKIKHAKASAIAEY